MKCYIDIGCNSLGGYKTLKKEYGINDTWEKIFVEPNPECHKMIEYVLTLSDNWKLLKCAVGLNSEEVTLITRGDMDSDSAATIMGKEYLDMSLAKWNQNTTTYNEYQVESRTLEQILWETDSSDIIMKMDCEGLEFKLLEIFPTSAYGRIRKLIVEFHCFSDRDEIRKQELMHQFRQNGINIEQWH